jgi:hypothetical protein
LYLFSSTPRWISFSQGLDTFCPRPNGGGPSIFLVYRARGETKEPEPHTVENEIDNFLLSLFFSSFFYPFSSVIRTKAPGPIIYRVDRECWESK